MWHNSVSVHNISLYIYIYHRGQLIPYTPILVSSDGSENNCRLPRNVAYKTLKINITVIIGLYRYA